MICQCYHKHKFKRLYQIQMRNNYEAAFVNNTIIPKAEAQRVLCITPRTKESEKFVFYFRKRVFINFFV